jgi:hypothetical protein
MYQVGRYGLKKLRLNTCSKSSAVPKRKLEG